MQEIAAIILRWNEGGSLLIRLAEGYLQFNFKTWEKLRWWLGKTSKNLSVGHALEDDFVHVADYPFNQIAITFRAECWKLPEKRIKHES